MFQVSYVENYPMLLGSVNKIEQAGPGYTPRCIFMHHHNGPLPRPVQALSAILAALEGDLCTILYVNFGEFTFHALR